MKAPDAATGYVVYGTAPWSSPWLTEQNLANALSGSRRVLYVEPAVSLLSPFRYGASAAAVRKLAKLARPRLRVEDGVHVLTPLTLPPAEHPRAQALSRPLLRAQVRRAARHARLDRPVALAGRAVLPLLGAANERALVYLVKDLTEAGGALLGKDPVLIANQMEAMCARADLVVTVTVALQETLARRGVESELLPHGFHTELAPLYDSAPPPREYAELPAPRIGYAGRIDARLDFEALERLADRYRSGSLILIGPVSPRLPAEELEPLARRPNVHLIGERDRDALPAYLRHLDCCLMPYRDSEWLRHGSPLKLWDYLYAGPPVAGCGCRALAEYPLLEFADSGADLPTLVDRAMRAGDGGRAERKAFALANSWSHRAAALERLLEERSPQRSR